MIDRPPAQCRRLYPTQWEVGPLGAVAEVNPESVGSDTPADHEFEYIDIASVSSRGVDWSLVRTLRYRSSPSRARRVVRPQDVLFCTVRPGLQAHAYADWGEDQVPRVCSTGFAVLRSRRIHPRFLYYLVFGNEVSAQVRALEVGSNYPAVNESDVARVMIPMPPLAEQRRIAEILDTADEAIRGTEALVGKLKAMKAGLLDDLLTRGLDEHGHLRDPATHPEQFKESPLGRIPREWEIQRLDGLCDRITDGSHQAVRTAPSGIPFLYVSCVRDGRILWDEAARITEHTYHEISRGREARRGAILYTAVGSYGHAAMLCDDRPISVQRHIAYVLPDERLVAAEYLVVWLDSESCKRHADSVALGNAQKTVTLGMLAEYPVPVPPAVEQQRIVATVDAHDARIRAEEAYLEKLKLQKKGLMHDLLTGVVRVAD